MPPEIDVIILQSIRYSLIWPVAWVPQLNPISAEWFYVWINPFFIPLLLTYSFAQFKDLAVSSISLMLLLILRETTITTAAEPYVMIFNRFLILSPEKENVIILTYCKLRQIHIIYIYLYIFLYIFLRRSTNFAKLLGEE